MVPSIPKDASEASKAVSSEEDIESFLALVTADQLANLKADFELQLGSQQADFEAQLHSQTAALVTADQHANLKAGFESVKDEFENRPRRSKSRLEIEGRKQLPPDTFSFLVCSSILSQPFLVGISVFLFQITIFGLLVADLINAFSENPLRIPENVETIVRVTQFLAIIIAVLTQGDL